MSSAKDIASSIPGIEEVRSERRDWIIDEFSSPVVACRRDRRCWDCGVEMSRRFRVRLNNMYREVI